MLNTLILVAQQQADQQARPTGLLDSPILPLLAMMVLFFFLIFLPGQRRERKQREQLLSRLKKNDEVITNSGIIGIVTSIKEGADEVTLKSEDTRLRVLKSSIARILTKESPKEGPAS